MLNKILFKQLIDFKIQSIIDYNIFVEKNIKEGVSEIQSQYDDFLKMNPEIENSTDEEYIENFASVVDDLAFENKKLNQDILYKHRQSIIIHFYSLLEEELFQFANLIQGNSQFKISDLKGNSTFDKFKLYLKKVDPDLLKSINNDLVYLDRIRLIRNFIVHHNSIIRDDNTHFNKINDFKKGKFELRFKGENKNGFKVFEIILNDSNFINEIFKNYKSFIEKIY
ncbi:hypothetical protein [Christiangramia sp. SM2212]|uniref:Cthe-2314-like HEPN domain-containing protein n=1 Tax=Christiangramia sediminicola TaxID=3073267 RepID=A0ABU1ERV6_9FLAO|nr:hypothetical protein [Christiangramia sp. SM2212]MDR5591127.1 hypothetical protein [Christiangramia sp. SM2212]